MTLKIQSHISYMIYLFIYLFDLLLTECKTVMLLIIDYSLFYYFNVLLLIMSYIMDYVSILGVKSNVESLEV